MEMTVAQVARQHARTNRFVQQALRSGALSGHRAFGRTTSVDDVAVQAWSRALGRGRRWTDQVREAALDLLSTGHTDRLSASERSRPVPKWGSREGSQGGVLVTTRAA